MRANSRLNFRVHCLNVHLLTQSSRLKLLGSSKAISLYYTLVSFSITYLTKDPCHILPSSFIISGIFFYGYDTINKISEEKKLYRPKNRVGFDLIVRIFVNYPIIRCIIKTNLMLNLVYAIMVAKFSTEIVLLVVMDRTIQISNWTETNP